MAGAVLDGELTAARPFNRVAFAVATPADDAPLRRLLREAPMHGAVRLTLEREPDYFRGESLGGGGDETIVARSGNRLMCMGRCSRRLCWVNGRAAMAGYLGELRLTTSAKGRFDLIVRGYRFFQQQERTHPAEIYFTSIASDNLPAQRLLESGARGLPAYRFVGELVTLLVAVPRHAPSPRIQLRPAKPDCLPALLTLLNREGQRHSLATVWTEEIVHSLRVHGLPLERFQLAFAGEEIVAAGALWDQRSFRQTVVRGYSPVLSTFRPLVNLGRSLLHTVTLPRPGSVIPLAFLSPMAMADCREDLLADFLAALFPLAASTGLEFLTVALPAADERLGELRRRFSAREWRSRIYQVTWPGHSSLPPKGTILPDIAFL